MPFSFNLAGQVGQIKLSTGKALWPLFETVINSIQSLEDTDISQKEVVIDATRLEGLQRKAFSEEKISEEPSHFTSFTVTDNGNGFNSLNYKSFLEAYSQLKVKKGCKGIGRFLWLKAFDKISINSTYRENGQWHNRSFDFSISGVTPEDNDKILPNEPEKQQTVVSLNGFKYVYREAVPYSLESLAKKLIEHCLPYFITDSCPSIILRDNFGESFNLNSYYEKTYKDSLNRDTINLKGHELTLYHMRLTEGADKHELHLCANSREVKSYPLTTYISNLQKKLVDEEISYYYVGYLAGECLDNAVNIERSDFSFDGVSMFTTETEIVDTAVGFIKTYLGDTLIRVAEEKKRQIDTLVKTKKPQYRFLLDRFPEIYDSIPAGLPEEKLDLELYSRQQKWEYDIAQKKHEIEDKVKQSATSEEDYTRLFDEYCENISELNRASLAEYVIHRKAVIDLLEKAMWSDENGKYSKEAQIHRIICPMQATSNEIRFDDMNLWLVDDRLAYHHFLASDKKINTIPLLSNGSDKRMDIAVFDAALSYSADPDNIRSITIVELKRPMRNDFSSDDKDPITQVYDYVSDIKDGNVRRPNGRGFGDTRNVAFYCYIIADLTPSLHKSAKRADLTLAQDGEGYFGFNSNIGTYIEIISYDKLLKDAKQRNQALFDKLFEPKASTLIHPELIEKKEK